MFMMVDLGGGSADITVHQKDIYNGLLREVIPPSCGPWDGKSIDDRFYIFLTEMFGADVMAELKNTELEDMIDLFREFETKKRSIRSNQLNNVVLKLPVTLINLVRSRCKKVEIAVEKSPYRDSVIFYVQSIHIMPDTFRDLFKPTIEALVEHLETMFRQAELRDLKTIVMVGGFSECELVQHKVMERFGRNITIIISEKAGPAILKGAVLYGHSMSQ
ncbi:unnamed protein product [Mytilus edulis]|uniref:Uncharacterized protein n=1 Tax=Mytilus edulis TaxID=6550 RepID=A0A8S3PSS3_MYTED|nr:unnamed protein product [Mytilus edulis]